MQNYDFFCVAVSPHANEGWGISYQVGNFWWSSGGFLRQADNGFLSIKSRLSFMDLTETNKKPIAWSSSHRHWYL